MAPDRWIVPCAAALLALASGCARPPAALRGEFAPVTVAEARADPRLGERVRWGGELVRATPEADGPTCFEVVAKPLDRAARPVAGDESTGRFVACAQGFYDPEVWSEGREVTAVGTVDGTVAGKVGEYDYSYPRVAAEAVHLWPERWADDRARSGGWIGGGTGGGSWGFGVGIGF